MSSPRQNSNGDMVSNAFITSRGTTHHIFLGLNSEWVVSCSLIFGGSLWKSPSLVINANHVCESGFRTIIEAGIHDSVSFIYTHRSNASFGITCKHNTSKYTQHQSHTGNSSHIPTKLNQYVHNVQHAQHTQNTQRESPTQQDGLGSFWK